jgi:hypothetical protein
LSSAFRAAKAAEPDIVTPSPELSRLAAAAGAISRTSGGSKPSEVNAPGEKNHELLTRRGLYQVDSIAGGIGQVC